MVDVHAEVVMFRGGRQHYALRLGAVRVPEVTDSGREFIDKLRVAEYESLRAESAQARAAQQTILQWSLAAFATIFAGGLLIAARADNASASRGVAGSLLLYIYGGGLPGFALCSCLTLLGEVMRMERAGHFLRGLERLVGEEWGVRPLQWESYISGAGAAAFGTRKSKVGYVGSTGIYFGAYLGSLGVFLVAVYGHQFAAHAYCWRIGLTVFAALATVLWLLVVVSLARSISRVGGTHAELRPSTSYADDAPAEQAP